MSVCVLSSSSSSSLSTRPARGSDTRTAALLGNKLRRLLRLPVPDRCAARCRVARRLECRCMADRYHNHTSPLLSLTYWIKHLPSCSWIAHPPLLPKIWRERSFLKCLWDEWSNTRKEPDDTQQMRSPKLFLSQASPNRPTWLTVLCPGTLQQFIFEMLHSK